jgi:hypothetical protein
VKASGPGGVFRTPVSSLNDGQRATFELSSSLLGDRSQAIMIEVYDEDWPDADDLIVRLAWMPPFSPLANARSEDGADYRVRVRLG